MAKTISISHQSSLPLGQTREALQTVFLGLKARYGVDGHWKSDKLFILSGPDIEGRVSLLDSASSVVKIDLSLGAALMMFSAVIESEIKSQLKRKLG